MNFEGHIFAFTVRQYRTVLWKPETPNWSKFSWTGPSCNAVSLSLLASLTEGQQRALPRWVPSVVRGLGSKPTEGMLKSWARVTSER